MSVDQLVFPDVRRLDARIALVSPLYVGTPERQGIEALRAAAAFRENSLPGGFVSFSAFGSTDGETLLTYAQWTSDSAYRRYQENLEPSADANRADPIRFVLYRSSVLDVDGPDRQRTSIDALVDGPLSKQIPGFIASHFHASLDGSRVLNWAEWTNEAAHEQFMQTAAPGEFLEAITMPGVRGIGGKRYTLLEAVTK
jgi:heme-degrading monooxygenase HmoA